MDTMTPPAPTVEKDLLKIATGLGPGLSASVEEEEKQGRLSPSTIDLLCKAGFYKLFLPKSLGGLEADPLTMAKIVEEVARFNTAAGWSLMVANTTAFSSCFLPAKGIEEIYGSNPDAFIAGTVYPPMRAVKTNGGYTINGKNPLTSNIHEADWIFATALIMENDQPKMEQGHPVVIGVFMKASECKIIDTWQTLGMKATDSNDAEVNNVFVPDHRMFAFVMGADPGQNFRGPLYKVPPATANIACLLSPVALAVATNAVEELKVLATKKTPMGSMSPMRDRGVVQAKLGKAEALVKAGRAYLHNIISETWKKAQAGEEFSLMEKGGMLLAATHVNQSCAEAVELVYAAAGTSGIYSKNKLSRLFTDSKVIRQHGFMNESRYETAGQVMLGLPPDVPLIAF